MKSTTLRKLLRSIRLLTLVVSVASFAWTDSASATLLPAGTFSTAITAAPGLGGGGTLVDTVSSVFTSPSVVFKGNLTTDVIRNDSANPFGTGNDYLTFTYQLSNFDGFVDPLEGLTLSDFNDPVTLAPFAIDVSYETPLLGETIPSTMRRALASGKIVKVDFLLLPDDTLATVVIHTALKNYRPGVAGVINSETASPIPTFVPVPEPSSVMLAALGLGAILLGKRHRGQVA